MKRPEKITLSSWLRNENHDFSAHCMACQEHGYIIPREEIMERDLPDNIRVDGVEAITPCEHCGRLALTFKVALREDHNDAFHDQMETVRRRK